MAKKIKNLIHDYEFWEDKKKWWTDKALRSFQIENTSKRVRHGGTDYLDAGFKALGKKVTNRMLDKVYMSMPPVVYHFTNGKEEIRTIASLRKAIKAKKDNSIIFEIQVEAYCGKRMFNDRFAFSRFIDNYCFDAIEEIAGALVDAVSHVETNLEYYFPPEAKVAKDKKK